MNHQNDPEKIQFKYIFNLNICGMAMTEPFEFPNSLKFLFDFVRSTYQNLISFSSINFRLILYGSGRPVQEVQFHVF